MLFIDSWVSDGHFFAIQATAFVLTFHFSAIKSMSRTARHCSSVVKISPVLMQRSTPVSSLSLVLHSSSIYYLAATFHHPSLHFLISSPQLSFVLRLQLHAAPPECQTSACWCQSRSPSLHGTCRGWHRTLAPLWPVPGPPGTLETPYPNSGPPQLLKKRH